MFRVTFSWLLRRRILPYRFQFDLDVDLIADQETANSSRSGMTRRIDRLVDEGLVTRANTDADGRGVVVALTEAGVTRLAEAVPVHLRRVSELFVERLADDELAVLANSLTKVAVDCGFG
jgi:DNA-binding MarR family transcriptional regulator